MAGKPEICVMRRGAHAPRVPPTAPARSGPTRANARRCAVARNGAVTESIHRHTRGACATRVFKQIDGVDAIPVNIAPVSDSDATLTGQPSGKTLKGDVIAANDAGQAAPSETVTIVVP